MSKGQQKQTYGAAQGQMTANNAAEASTNTQLQSVLGNAQGTASSLLPSITGNFANIANTGGYDSNSLNTLNTAETNLATTGGISPAQVTAMEDKASQAAQSTYSTGRDAAQRARAGTGGYGVAGSLDTSLARQGSNAAAAATTGVDASITGLQQGGEIAGVSGLNTTQQNIAGNKLAATSGQANIYGLNENQVSTTVNQILQNYQQTGQLNNQDLSVLTNLANQPGVFDKIVSTLGTLGGAVGGILTGINGGKK